MNTKSRHDRPFVTVDPRLSLPISLVDECEDPTNCYPTDDGEIDLVDPGPSPAVPESSSSPSGIFPQPVVAQLRSAQSVLLGFFSRPAALPVAAYA